MFWPCTTPELAYTLSMDGFNTIPIENTNSGTGIPASVQSNIPIQTNPVSSNVEIADSSKKIEKKGGLGSTLFLIAILSIVAVLGYFVFLVFYRISMLNQIVNYGDQMQTISKNIDKAEMEEFRSMDKILKTINEKLGKHVLNSQILIFVNNNIRNTLQITEYRVEVKEKDVDVSLTAIAPSFKEFAEQTEKLFVLKEEGNIKSFNISNMAFESETRRLRFTTRLVFDRSKVSASALSGNNNQ